VCDFIPVQHFNAVNNLVEEPARLWLWHALLRDNIVEHLTAGEMESIWWLTKHDRSGGVRIKPYPSQHSMIR
jgi:hypothetical protein